MNVGRAITAGMYAERVRDLERFAREIEWRYVVHAYAWWGSIPPVVKHAGQLS